MSDFYNTCAWKQIAVIAFCGILLASLQVPPQPANSYKEIGQPITVRKVDDANVSVLK